MNQIVITSCWVIVIAWLGIASAKIDFRQPATAVHRAQQQPDYYYSIDKTRPNDKAALSWVDYKRSYASRPYSFNYKVNNDVDDNDYGHQQASDGSVTSGSYRVLLPDGRRQIVHFTADSQNGYVANVKYEQIKPTSSVRVKSPPNDKKNKKPWTAFNNNNKNQMTSYKANLIAAFGLKINHNNKMTSSSKTSIDTKTNDVIPTSIKYDDANIRSWTAFKEVPIYEAKAVYHQQPNDYESTRPIETPAMIYGANHQEPINRLTTSNIRNGYVAPTTYRPAIPYSIPSSSTPPAWTWLTSAAPVKQPVVAAYSNYSNSRLPTPLIFRTRHHSSND